MVKENVIKLENVSVVRQGQTILQGIDWQVKAHQCWAILGANGSGKSTLAGVLCGYIWPADGTVAVLGETFGRTDMARLRSRIGLVEVSRVPQFYPETPVREIIATGLFGTIILPWYKDMGPDQWQVVDCEIKEMGLEEFVEQPFGRLSTGEQAKVLIARAMVSRPQLLILDEPTAGLDIGNRMKVITMLEKLAMRNNPPTVIVISHHVAELPRTITHTLVLKQGQILRQGQCTEVITSEVMSEAFDCPMRITQKRNCFQSRILLL